MAHESDISKKSYFLPSDEEEYKRLNRQHVGIVTGLGGSLYPASDVVHTILAPEEGKIKRVLDLGCGSGIWTATMAQQFPHAEVLGLDINPPSPKNAPANCSFQKHDINVGLSAFENQYDLIHARLIGSGIRDFRKMKDNIIQCLKPGGMMVLIDVDYTPLKLVEDGFGYYPPALDGDEEGSYYARMLHESRRATLVGDVYPMWDVLNGGLWNEELLVSESCGAANLYFPLGTTWVEDPDPNQLQRLKSVGQLMKEDFRNLQWSIHPILLKHGIPKETLVEWSTKADKELNNEVHHPWMRFLLTWGRRRSDPNESAPLLPLSSEEGYTKEPPYRYFIPFHTREEGLAIQEKLDQSRTFPVPS